MINLVSKNYEDAQDEVLRLAATLKDSTDPAVHKEDRASIEVLYPGRHILHSSDELRNLIRATSFHFISDTKIIQEYEYWQALVKNESLVERIVETLTLDMHSRRALITVWRDEFRRHPNMPGACVIDFYARVVDGRICFGTTARANDIVNCIYIDFIFIRHIFSMVADMLDLELGSHSHFVFALQVYKKDTQKLNDYVQRT